MALLGKTDWYSAEKKIILTIALAILIASVSVFAILYLMMSHALQEDIRARARVVNAYAESHLNLEGFVHINTPKDMRRDTYQDMQSMLDNIRQIANVRYLYTAKFNDRGQPCIWWTACRRILRISAARATSLNKTSSPC